MFATGTALAGPETNVSSGFTLKGPGLAVHDYDVVAYFTKGQATIGRAKHSTVYKDATYRFASEEHLEAFEDDPEKCQPQYGGYCAYGVAVGAKFDGDPLLWRIVDGKLHLNLNEEIQATWKKGHPRPYQEGRRELDQDRQEAPPRAKLERSDRNGRPGACRFDPFDTEGLAMASDRIKLKRAYEAPSDNDGPRILVERLWPRGLSKAAAAIDHWLKDVAPTPQLRTWFGHRPERWPEFRKRYRAELTANSVAVETLRELCARQPVTFVFAARDVERNGAVVLREFLLSEHE